MFVRDWKYFVKSNVRIQKIKLTSHTSIQKANSPHTILLAIANRFQFLASDLFHHLIMIFCKKNLVKRKTDKNLVEANASNNPTHRGTVFRWNVPWTTPTDVFRFLCKENDMVSLVMVMVMVWLVTLFVLTIWFFHLPGAFQHTVWCCVVVEQLEISLVVEKAIP